MPYLPLYLTNDLAFRLELLIAALKSTRSPIGNLCKHGVAVDPNLTGNDS
jgi:hypothetical protein